MITQAVSIMKRIRYLNNLKVDVECKARRKEALAVQELRASWNIKNEKEASEIFEMYMLHPGSSNPAYPKFREEYRKESGKLPAVRLFFETFVSEYYLNKRELVYLEEVFTTLNIQGETGCKNYEELCLKIMLLEREMFSFIDAAGAGCNDNLPKNDTNASAPLN